MAEGEYLKGTIDGIPYKLLNSEACTIGLETRLKEKANKIEKGEFHYFFCAEDNCSNRISSLKELAEILRPKLKINPRYIVQITANENIDDFGYAIMKLLENYPDAIKSKIEIDKRERTIIYIKNLGLIHLVCSSDAWDFYRRIYEDYIAKK